MSRPDQRFRLTIVVEMANAIYWEGHGEEAGEAVAQFYRMARAHPDVEILFVTDGPTRLGDEGLANLRCVASPDPTYFAMKRLGVLEARSELIAIADSDCIYPQDYIEQLLEAFADPQVQLVAGRTRYPAVCARAKAASVKDWGHLPGQGSSTMYFAANNFAARRAVLEKYHFGMGFQRVAGEIMLSVLARMDGIEPLYLPNLLAMHHDFRDALAPSWYKAFMDYPASVDFARRAMNRLGVSPWRKGAFLRAMSVHVFWVATWASIRSYRNLRRELDIHGVQRITVPLWLGAFTLQGAWFALRGFLQPRWLLRKGNELGFTLSPELDRDANHPLNQAIDRSVAWVREDRSRIHKLLLPRKNATAGAPAAGPTVSTPRAS